MSAPSSSRSQALPHSELLALSIPNIPNFNPAKVMERATFKEHDEATREIEGELKACINYFRTKLDAVRQKCPKEDQEKYLQYMKGSHAEKSKKKMSAKQGSAKISPRSGVMEEVFILTDEMIEMAIEGYIKFYRNENPLQATANFAAIRKSTPKVQVSTAVFNGFLLPPNGLYRAQNKRPDGKTNVLIWAGDRYRSEMEASVYYAVFGPLRDALLECEQKLQSFVEGFTTKEADANGDVQVKKSRSR